MTQREEVLQQPGPLEGQEALGVELDAFDRVPLVPLIPILSMIASFVLIVSLPLVTIIRFIVWLVIGLIIYFLYSQRKSHLRDEIPPLDEGTVAEEQRRGA